MRAPPLVRRLPPPKVHKRTGARGQLVFVREIARDHKLAAQYEANVVLERAVLPRGGAAVLQLFAGYGDSIEEAVDAACEVRA